MKQIIGHLTLIVLAFTACNNIAEKSNHQQDQEVTKQQSEEADKQHDQGTIMKHLKITRHFEVEPDLVFKAFTNPDDMLVWWSPDTKFNIDLKEGGLYVITRQEGETTLTMTGEYLKVNQPTELVYTCAMPDYSPVVDTISLTIQPDGKGGSELTFIQKGKGIDHELEQLSEGATSQSEEGWNEGFDLMAEAWSLNKE